MDHPIRLADAQKLQQRFSSSCIISEPEPHEVFLSHSGKQKSFVSDLYNAFLNWPRCPRIDPFFDQSRNSLPVGEEFPDRLFQAARKCLVGVVILTKEFVTSKWPMLELLTFVEAQKTTNPNLKLLPVFYDLPTSLNIDPSWIEAWESMTPKSDGTSPEVRKRTTISVELCKEALRKLKATNGVLKKESLQSLQEEIVKAAAKLLPSSSELDTENVQGCLRLCESVYTMFRKNSKGVYCLGLYGMGGLGKTTVCKELCSYFGPRVFGRVCHLEIGSNETDMEKKKFKRHIKILESLSQMPENQISKLDYHNAEKCVQQCLSNKKPKFLAVDNVQDSLASRQEAENYLKWLSPESIIIITSRTHYNLRSVTTGIHCKHIPNLDDEEAMTLFLKIAAPQVDRQSLNRRHIRILEKCLRICFFSRTKEINRDQVPVEDGDHTGNGFHPLALRAVASYFRDRYTGPDSILSWEEALKDKDIIFLLAADSTNIFDVLGLGFNDKSMSELTKQLFIDVALFAPPPVEEEDIFNWLIAIHHGCNPKIIREKLRQLRRKSFLNFGAKAEETLQNAEETCKNISMHELYREFAKGYISNEDGGLFKYGVYDGGDLPPPSLENPRWVTVPRIHLQRLMNVVILNGWRNVAVVHLAGCELSTFSIGDLLSLRDLAIARCPKLEVLSWTQDIATKQVWGTKLRFVHLSSNKSLRKLPDFSNCAELQDITVEGCSSSVEPIKLHTCSNLQVLCLLGNDVPEVQSIKSCPKLRAVRLAWKATHKSLPLLDDLDSLSELRINGPSDVSFNQMEYFSPLLKKNQFWKQHPKDRVCHELSVVGVLPNLQTVEFTCLPLGKLAVQLAASGPNLQNLTLSGCLLSKSVDFSAFPNLQYLKIRWTNVKEVLGLDHLSKNLRCLDCAFCFRLRKVPDLRPLTMLRAVSFTQCPKLQGIPRLPPGTYSTDVVHDGSEDERRAILASLAFAETPAIIPPPGFALLAGARRSRGIPSQFGRWPIHWLVGCDGCRTFPMVGQRYKAKPVETFYSLCSNCFSKNCYCSERRKPRWKAVGKLTLDYNLCSSCYAIAGCNLSGFYEIDETYSSDQGPKPTVTLIQADSELGLSVSNPSGPYTNNADRFMRVWDVFTLKVKESPFNTKPIHILH